MSPRGRPPAVQARRLTAALLHRYPLYSGCGRIANSAPLRRLASWPSDRIAEARLHDGSRLLVPTDDFVGRAVLFFGDLDPKVTQVCERLLRPGDVMVDAGANVGLVALFASARVGDAGRVHAFEPQPRLVRLLRESVRLNGRSNVAVHDVALGAEADRLTLHVPSQNRGAASFVRAPERGETVDVPVRRLADCLREVGDRPIRLVKLDVEGFEHAVLEGARPLLRRRPPDTVLFECNDRGPFWEHPVVGLLQEYGYEFLVPRGRFLSPRFESVGLDVVDPPAHDVLAVHASVAGEVRQALARRRGASA